MNGTPYIPAATLAEMQSPHPPGTRHAAMFKIAMPLIGNGMSPSAVQAQLRDTFPDPDKTDAEIANVVRWAVERNPTPSGYGTRQPSAPRRVTVPRLAPITAKEAIDRANDCTSGAGGESELFDASPVRPSENFVDDAALLMRTLYAPDEGVNIVRQFTISEKGKANPLGAGKTLPPGEWLEWFATNGVPSSDAGGWMRPNPCGPGTGKGGAVRDCDVTAFRFLLLESDILPVEVQFAMLSRLNLPIAAVITSGGGSVHAWLKVDAQDAEHYSEIAASVFAVLEPFGYDTANKNPSRLSRLPGVTRKIGAGADPRQRLLYLNPTPAPLDLAALTKATAPRPAGITRGEDMGDRMREHMRAKPPAFTIPFFVGKTAEDGFHMRDGEVTLWTGMSGHGKSTMLATVMLNLIAAKIPMFICSLEYKPEKLCELMARVMYERPVSSDEAVGFVKGAGRLFTLYDKFGEIEQSALLELMRYAAARHGAKHFFLDSLMRVASLDEDFPAQGKFLNDLQAVAKETGGHIHVVAHPRKIDEDVRARKMDVKGSSMITNNADNIISIRRNTEKRKLMEAGELAAAAELHDAELSVEKQRETGWEGMVRLNFNAFTKQFTKFEYAAPPPAKPTRRKYHD